MNKINLKLIQFMRVVVLFEYGQILFHVGFVTAFCFHEYTTNVNKPNFALLKIIYKNLLRAYKTYSPVLIDANYTILSNELHEK